MEIDVVFVDYNDPRQAADLGDLLDCYAKDPMGGATPLSADVKNNLAKALANIPYAFSVICCVPRNNFTLNPLALTSRKYFIGRL